MKTEKGFVINWSKKDAKAFTWFVRHPQIKNSVGLMGGPQPLNRGDVEAYLNKIKRKVTKLNRQ